MNGPRSLKIALAGAFLCVWACLPAGQALGAESPWIRFNGDRFVDLRVYGLAQNLHYSWDPVAKNAVLEGAGNRFQFHAGSEYFMKDGRLQKMDAKAVFLNDALAAPGSAGSFLPGLKNEAPIV